MAELLNARKIRATNEVQVDLGDGTFIRAHKEDMTLLVFEGRVPMPMLAAVQKMIDMPNASPMERIEALGSEHGKTLVDVLRAHVCKVSIEPIIVMAEDGNPDHLPVTYLDVPRMMAIWSATAVVPLVTQDAAATFRGGADAPVADAVPNVESVRPPAEFVAPAGVEMLSR